MILRRYIAAAAAAAFIITGVGAAQAGGTWLEPSDTRIEAGDKVEFTATVDRGTLGWVDDGPYYVYLQGDGFGEVIEEGLGGSATDVSLGELDFADQSPQLDVAAIVTIPADTPPGEYWVTVCNDPCTTGLGDLVGALVYVGVDPPDVEAEKVVATATPTTTAAPTTPVSEATVESLPRRMALAPYPSRSAALSPLWVGFSAAIAGAVLLLALVSRQRG